MSESGVAVVVSRGLELKVPAPPSIHLDPQAQHTVATPPAPRPEILSSEPEGFAARVLSAELPPAPAPAPAPAQPHVVESRVAALEDMHAKTVNLMDQLVHRLESPDAPKPETPDAMAELIERLSDESPELRALAEAVAAQGSELKTLRAERAAGAARAQSDAADTFLFDGMSNLKAVYPSLTEDEGRRVATWFLDPKNQAVRQVLSFREVAGRALGNDILESRRFTAGSPAPPKGAKPALAASPANLVPHSVPGAGAGNGSSPTTSPENIREAVAVVLRDHSADLGRYS